MSQQAPTPSSRKKEFTIKSPTDGEGKIKITEQKKKNNKLLRRLAAPPPDTSPAQRLPLQAPVGSLRVQIDSRDSVSLVCEFVSCLCPAATAAVTTGWRREEHFHVAVQPL